MVQAMRADTSFCVSTCAPAPHGRARTAANPAAASNGNDMTLLLRLRSLFRNAGALDHGDPLGNVGLEMCLQFPWRAGLGLDPEIGVTLLHLGGPDDLADGSVEDAYDLRRRAGAGKYSVPGYDLVAWNTGFGDGGYVGEKGRGLRAGGRNRANLL